MSVEMQFIMFEVVILVLK